MPPAPALPKSVAQQIIQQHSRQPRWAGDIAATTHQQEGHNPTCGDRVRLALNIQGGVIQDIQVRATGCAISAASADLMAGLVRGKALAQALALADQFDDMLRTGQADPVLGDAAALAGVHTLHTRVKCAALGWQTLRLALAEDGD